MIVIVVATPDYPLQTFMAVKWKSEKYTGIAERLPAPLEKSGKLIFLCRAMAAF